MEPRKATGIGILTMMLYPRLALIITSDASVGIVTDTAPVTEVLPIRFQVNLPFSVVRMVQKMSDCILQ